MKAECNGVYMSQQADAEERELEVDDLELESGAIEPEAEEPEEPEEPEEGAEGEDEDEISFGDGAAPAPRGADSGLVKQLRQQLREKSERLAALERGDGAPKPIEVGPKPTIEGCDFDEAKFEAEYEAWQQRKAQAEAQQTEAQKRNEAVNAAFVAKVADFGRQKADLKVKDFADAEETAAAALSQVQLAVVIKVAENSAALIYALGKHPQKLATVAAIEDPIELAAAVARLEGTMKVNRKTRAPVEPDRPERGSAPLSASTDKELERLEKEAQRTGDRTAVIAHKRKLKAQGRT